MPWETTPRIFERLSFLPSGSVVPDAATATFCPAATLGAPQTTSRVSASPRSTLHTESRSAFGWAVCSSTRRSLSKQSRRCGRP